MTKLDSVNIPLGIYPKEIEISQKDLGTKMPIPVSLTMVKTGNN
jgi:hypothetical protein